MYNNHTITKVVEPNRIHLGKAEEELAESMASLSRSQIKLRNVNDKSSQVLGGLQQSSHDTITAPGRHDHYRD